VPVLSLWRRALAVWVEDLSAESRVSVRLDQSQVWQNQP